MQVTWVILLLGVVLASLTSFVVSLTMLHLRYTESSPVGISGLSGHWTSLDEVVKYLRTVDFHRLDQTIYMDFAGAGILTDSQIVDSESTLATHLIVNPQSIGIAADYMKVRIDYVKKTLLRKLLNTTRGKYTVLFTASDAAAWEMLGKSFPWSESSTFWYDQDVRQDVIGIRMVAERYDAKYMTINTSVLSGVPVPDRGEVIGARMRRAPTNMMVLPLVNGFDGRRMPHEIARAVTNAGDDGLLVMGEGCFVVGDSTATGRAMLDLYDTPFHAVVLSLNELFGIADMGAVVVRNDALKWLRHTLTVTGNDSLGRTWEDNDVPFGRLLCIDVLLKSFDVLPVGKAESRAFVLAQKLYQKMNALNISGIDIYGVHELHNETLQAPFVTFAIKDVSPVVFVSKAREAGFVIGGVCKESLHSCLIAAGVNESQFVGGFDRTRPIIEQVIADHRLGALRVSLGWASLDSDVDSFVEWLKATQTAYA